MHCGHNGRTSNHQRHVLSRSSERQGETFERTFAELVERILRDDLGLSVLQVSRQPRGFQHGKDLQIRWINRQGAERRWHFECKSHRGTVLPEKEVADKLLEAARSLHDIDVWCLALANAEPSTAIDELFASTPQRFSFQFAIATLSPRRGFIRRLYACYPMLYREQYSSDAPALTRRERRRTVEDFELWLENESARRPRNPLPSEWRLITTAGFALGPNDSQGAARYLRGLTLTCPWEAVAYGWAVARPTAEEPLLRFASEAGPGLAARWRVAAGGEGKSTVLRRVAWQIARDETARVLWTDDRLISRIPLEWIDGRSSGTRVLLCVDGTCRF